MKILLRTTEVIFLLALILISFSCGEKKVVTPSAQFFWQQVNSGLTNTQVYALTVNANGDIFAGTLGGGVFRSTDNGDNWIQINTGLTDTNVLSLAIDDSGYIFAGTTKDGVFRSTNNGASWTQTSLNGTKIYSIAIDRVKGAIFAGTALSSQVVLVDTITLPGDSSITFIYDTLTVGGAFRSTNNGDNWTEINSGLTGAYLYALAINNSGFAFAGISSGVSGGGVFRSTDYGTSWVSTGLAHSYISSLVINSNGDIFAGVGAGVFRSTDNGANWTQINTGLAGTGVRALTINSEGHIFAGTWDAGVFLSTNQGANWTQVNSGLTNTEVLCFAANANGQVFAGTSGGIFRSK